MAPDKRTAELTALSRLWRNNKLAKRCLLAASLVLLVCLFWAGIREKTTVAEAGAAPEQITLTWTEDSKTTQTISWLTDSVQGQVQYKTAKEVGKAKFAASIMPGRWSTVAAAKLAAPEGNKFVQTATLTGLQPGTRYLYRVGDGATWSEEHEFVTAPKQDAAFKFLLFGDSQSVNYDVWQGTVQQAYWANPDAAFFTNMGDLVDNGQDAGQWHAWFKAAAGVIDSIPAMPVLGNHEFYGPQKGFFRPDFFTTYFNLPANGPAELKGQVYSFNYGSVHFIVLDSQFGEEAALAPSMLTEQQDWLARDLAAAQAKWKIVFLHKPPAGSSANAANGGNEALKNAFAPLFAQYGVDVVFTAHDHVYARTAGKPLYVATGRSGSKTYPQKVNREGNAFFYNPVDGPMYLTVTVSGNTLTVKACAIGGQVIDSWTIEKKQGGIHYGYSPLGRKKSA